jgi:TrmH family RNA methyltransferase
LLRSADAFGADAFIVEADGSGIRRGARAGLPVHGTGRVGNRVRSSWLREREFRVVATSPDAQRMPSGVDLRGRVAILLGSEEHGLDPKTLAGADERVRIPMRGRADSLNVSVSAGVLLYEADRQRAGG